MRTKITFSIIFIFAVSLFLFPGWIVNKIEEQTAAITASGFSINSGYTGDPFLIGALNNGLDHNFQHAEELGFNVWHNYIHPKTGWGAKGDTLYAHIDHYKGIVGEKLSTASSYGMNSIIMRPKIYMLCFGKRSDYQCEKVPLNDDLWFYSFNVSKEGEYIEDITDNSIHGNGTRVKYCHGDPFDAINRADTIVKRLKANTEQCFSFADERESIDSSLIKWIIKPRIRIDSAVAHSVQNPLVCKIKVIGHDGSSILKEVDIRANYFVNTSGNYNGKYIEEFNFPSGTDLEINGFWGNWWHNAARGNSTVDTANQVDIQVYWYGNCDMWIDYVRVDNLVAHRLLDPEGDEVFEEWLLWEARDIACYQGDLSSVIKFYIELWEFSNIPCMAYVSRKLDSIAFANCQRNINLTTLTTGIYSYHVPWEDRFTVMNTDHYIKNFIEKVGSTDILIACYPFYTNKQYTFPYGPTFAKIPNTLPVTSGPGVLANPIAPSAYDDSLQNTLDHSPAYFETGSTKGFPHWGDADEWEGAFRWTMKLGDAVSKAKDIPFLYNAQAHLWYYAELESHKEPTNEEMEMIANVSLTYGVRGLIYFQYNWWYGPDNVNCPNMECYGTGFADIGNEPRTENAYGQDKWDMIKKQVQRLKKWEPYIMSFDNANRKSAIYRDVAERSDFLNTTYFNDVITYKPGSGNPSCVEDGPGETDPTDYIFDCLDKRYLQTAVFKNDSANTNYFMIVNRRCSPHINTSNDDMNGGRRWVKVRFDNNSPAFSNFNNWKIVNLETDAEVTVFDKSYSGLVDLGIFQPGEGKLFKIAPVMQEGGTLVTDEVVTSEQTFTCKAPVFNDGNDITIEYGVTIKFLQASYIEMDKGSLYCGDLQSGTEVILTAETGNTWNGLTLMDNPRVEILNTVFENIGVDVPTYTAVKLSNPHVLKIIQSQFVNNNSNNLSVTVDYNFTTQPREITAIINSNTFNTFGSEMVGIYCSGSSSVDLQMQWNDFTNPSSTTGINGLTLSGVSGGVVKNNTFTNFSTSVKTMNSSVDYFNNQITSSFNGFGLELTSTSNANMSGPSDLVFGGNNFFYNDHNEAINLKVENSTFEIAEGYNYFDITETAPITSYHLFGYFPSPGFGEPAQVEAMYNCFKFSGEPTEDPRANVTWGAFGGQIDFIFEDFDCSGAEEYNVGLIVELGEGQFDTIYSKSGGSSGGQSGGMTTLTYNELVNEMYLLTRKKEYEDLYEICEQLLQSYPDSSSTNDALSKIYLAALKTDVEGNIIGDMKTLLEQLILNNGNNSRLIEKSFYLIQKCKAALGD